jgi:hypothetical protein
VAVALEGFRHEGDGRRRSDIVFVGLLELVVVLSLVVLDDWSDSATLIMLA